MTQQQIAKLARSNEAPNDWVEFAIWMHNKTMESVTRDVVELRNKTMEDVDKYKVCNKILRDFLKEAEA